MHLILFRVFFSRSECTPPYVSSLGMRMSTYLSQRVKSVFCTLFCRCVFFRHALLVYYTIIVVVVGKILVLTKRFVVLYYLGQTDRKRNRADSNNRMLFTIWIARGVPRTQLSTQQIFTDYIEQGDMSMYTREKLAERRKCAQDPRLHASIKARAIE